jgi:hypothetical protein
LAKRRLSGSGPISRARSGTVRTVAPPVTMSLPPKSVWRPSHGQSRCFALTSFAVGPDYLAP